MIVEMDVAFISVNIIQTWKGKNDVMCLGFG